MTDTIAAVFPDVYTVDVPDNTNRELFASSNAGMKRSLVRKTASIGNASLRQTMTDTAVSLTRASGGPHVMTDDKAPVERLGMQAIDQIIGDELGYYKRIYHRQGLGALIDVVLQS